MGMTGSTDESVKNVTHLPYFPPHKTLHSTVFFQWLDSPLGA
jgi:hypothetical protein